MEQAILRAESHSNSVLPFTLREDARDATQLIIPSPSFEVQEESPFRETPEEQPRKPFIEANTKAVTLGHLQNDCITPGILQGQRGDHIAQSVHRNHVGVCPADVPKLYGRGARNTGEPYRQRKDARSHPQGRKGPH